MDNPLFASLIKCSTDHWTSNAGEDFSGHCKWALRSNASIKSAICFFDCGTLFNQSLAWLFQLIKPSQSDNARYESITLKKKK
jgi:hypothetical protein